MARALVFAIAILWPGWSASAAEEAPTLEHRVKAAFLYQFAGYVDWPPKSFERTDTPVTIAVVGAEPLAAELSSVTVGRTMGGRRVTVRRMKAGDSLAGVHILFVGRAESARLSQLASRAHQRAILTVSESEGALAQGSMINFIIVDRRVRFEVALDSAERSGLRLSSRLLAVAEQVRTETH
jgi:hypothetical protein